MYAASKKCDDRCIRPVGKRLALFGSRDEYECYAESYVKCFWGLCDHQKSVDAFANTAQCGVITQQPARQDMPLRSPGIIQRALVTH